jgi:hypothetical protein
MAVLIVLGLFIVTGIIAAIIELTKVGDIKDISE